MNGQSLTSFAKKAGWAAVIGIGGSVLVNTVLRDTQRAKRLLAYSALSGLAGASIGCTFAVIRKQNLVTSSVSASSSFFLISGTFFVLRDSLLVSSKAFEWRRRWDEWQGTPVLLAKREAMSRMCASALSGGTTAFLFSCAIWRGPDVLLLNIMQGTLLGVGGDMPTSQKVFVRPTFIGDSFDLGQWLANKIRVWILEETIKHHYPELVANANANKENWEQRWTRRLAGRSRGSYLNEKIRSFEIQLEILKDEEARLLKVLHERDKKNSDTCNKEE